MGYEQVVYETRDGVATVTLNRPDRLNAWTQVMGREVRAAMDEAAVFRSTGTGRRRKITSRHALDAGLAVEWRP
jgi:1,4-dihydroxy-2-naphthoyl-CoA synthase